MRLPVRVLRRCRPGTLSIAMYPSIQALKYSTRSLQRKETPSCSRGVVRSPIHSKFQTLLSEKLTTSLTAVPMSEDSALSITYEDVADSTLGLVSEFLMVFTPAAHKKRGERTSEFVANTPPSHSSCEVSDRRTQD
jgi:hypothetical protein